MSLGDLGNLGEFLGGIAVVVSLIYLAAQIRQNTKQVKESSQALRIAAFDENFKQWAGWRRHVIDSQEVADLLLRGLSDRATLSETHLIRWNLLMGEYCYILQSMFERSNASRYRYHRFWSIKSMSLLFESESGRTYWSEIKPGLLKEFVEAVEEHHAME